MEKDELKKHYSFLNELHNEFLLEEMKYKGKGNRTVKDTAYRNLESFLLRFENYVNTDFELYTLITKSGTDFDRAINWDEIASTKYFGRDMSKILNRIYRILNE